MIEVDVNGTIVEFPDETPKAVMQAALQKKFGAPDPAQVPVGTTGRPEIGRGAALGLGVAQGAGANFADETAGVLAASGGVVPAGPMSLPATALKGGAKLLYDYLTGSDTGTSAYEGARDTVRESTKAAEEQYPGTYLTGNIAGAVASPITRLVRTPAALGAGAGFVERMRQAIPYGIKTGGLYGAAQGAGEGEDLTERVTKAAAGGLTGAAIGGAVPPVVEGALRAGGAVARPVISAVRGITNPEGEAARRAGLALQRDVQSDPNAVSRLTGQEFGQSAQSGGPATLMDMGGEATRALARSSANTSPEGRAVLSQSINDRFEQQAPRMVEWFNNTFNYGTPQAREQAIKQVAQNIYEPKYAKAWKDSRNTPLWDSTLEELSQAPEVQNAIRVANSKFRNWAALDGFPVQQRDTFNVFKLEPGRTSLVQSKSGASERMPSLQRWDYVKRALDQSGDPTAAMFAKALRDHLDTLVPAYKAARESAQPTKFFEGARNAFEAGQSYVNKGQRFGPEAQQQINRMTPEERKLFQDGYVSSLIEKIEKSPDRRNILNSIAQSPAARREVETALGSQRWKELEATLRVEGIMDLARPAVQGNSTTARQLMELGLAGGVGGFDYLTSGDPSAAMHAALVWGAARGQRGIDARVARHVAQLLTSSDPQKLLQGVKMVAKSNAMVNQLRRVDAHLAKIGAQQSPRPVLNLPGAGNTEDNQPSVPRPPGQ